MRAAQRRSKQASFANRVQALEGRAERKDERKLAPDVLDDVFQGDVSAESVEEQ